MFVQSGEEGIGEKLVVAGSKTEVMFDVGECFFKVKRGEGVANGNALVEGLVGGEAKFGIEVGLTDEDEGEQGMGIEIVIEKETELVKEFSGQEVGFIDDEQGEAIFAGEGGEGVAELGKEAGEGVSGFNLKSEEDLRIESSDVEVGIGEVNQRMQGRVE